MMKHILNKTSMHNAIIIMSNKKRTNGSLKDVNETIFLSYKPIDIEHLIKKHQKLLKMRWNKIGISTKQK